MFSFLGNKWVLLTVFLGLIFSPLVFGQNQNSGMEVVLNWTSQTYAPSGYVGKTLPTGNSWITATVDVIQNGKIVNIDKENIYWYKDDQFINGGVGLWQINIKAPEIPGDILSLRVELPDLGVVALKTVDVPIAQPVVVLNAPYPGGYVSGPKIRISALTYFFDAQDPSNLRYDWKVNGETVKNLESPLHIELVPREGTPDGFALNIQVNSTDPKNVFVGAKRLTSLVFKKK